MLHQQFQKAEGGKIKCRFTQIKLTSLGLIPLVLPWKGACITTAAYMYDFHRFETYLAVITLDPLFFWNPISRNIQKFGFLHRIDQLQWEICVSLYGFRIGENILCCSHCY